jgi:hypothetical protein
VEPTGQEDGDRHERRDLRGFGRRPLAPGWTKETAIAAFGGGEFDLSDAPPGEGARLVAIAVFGGIRVRVAPGTRVTMGGFSAFGARDARVTPGEGPEMRIIAVAILGGIRIEENAAP